MDADVAIVGAGIAGALIASKVAFLRMKATEIHHNPDSGFQGAGHVIGTTRMGKDARTSVVDGDLRAHDHRNLFLVGSAAVPTSGAATPTLTIAALAQRSVDAI